MPGPTWVVGSLWFQRMSLLEVERKMREQLETSMDKTSDRVKITLCDERQRDQEGNIPT